MRRGEAPGRGAAEAGARTGRVEAASREAAEAASREAEAPGRSAAG